MPESDLEAGFLTSVVVVVVDVGAAVESLA